jgi:putative transposase
MRKQITEGAETSRVVWDNLEEWVRENVQGFIQSLLEEEITELLGRGKSERKNIDSPPGYRNGYGKERKLTLGCGTISVQRPRVRGLEERFESQVLPMFARRARDVNALLPELYLHGLALGDCDLALRGLLGEDAPVSASTVARLKEKWQDELQAWRTRSLEGTKIVYAWVDGVYVKAGLEKEKAALLVVIGARLDGRKVVLAVEPGYRESTESWTEVLRDLRDRGLECPCVFVGDGHLGIWGGLRNIYPQAEEQRCWNHKMMNVVDKLPKKLQSQAGTQLREVMYSKTRKEAEEHRDCFVKWCREKNQQRAGEALMRDWERMVTFYRFPQEHWVHLRTSNIVESPFASLRLRTNASKRYKKVENATALIWKMLLLGEQRFRRLNAPSKLMQVYREFDGEEPGVETESMKDEVLAIA